MFPEKYFAFTVRNVICMQQFLSSQETSDHNRQT